MLQGDTTIDLTNEELQKYNYTNIEKYIDSYGRYLTRNNIGNVTTYITDEGLKYSSIVIKPKDNDRFLPYTYTLIHSRPPYKFVKNDLGKIKKMVVS